MVPYRFFPASFRSFDFVPIVYLPFYLFPHLTGEQFGKRHQLHVNQSYIGITGNHAVVADAFQPTFIVGLADATPGVEYRYRLHIPSLHVHILAVVFLDLFHRLHVFPACVRLDDTCQRCFRRQLDGKALAQYGLVYLHFVVDGTSKARAGDETGTPLLEEPGDCLLVYPPR